MKVHIETGLKKLPEANLKTNGEISEIGISNVTAGIMQNPCSEKMIRLTIIQQMHGKSSNISQEKGCGGTMSVSDAGRENFEDKSKNRGVLSEFVLTSWILKGFLIYPPVYFPEKQVKSV